MKMPFEQIDLEGLSREEARKRRKRREQLQAYGLIGGGVLFIVLLVSVIVVIASGGIKRAPKEETAAADEIITPSDVPPKEETEKEVSAAEQVASATAEKEAVAEEAAAEDPEQVAAKILEDAVQDYIDAMTLEEKVASLFFVTPEQLLNSSKVTEVGGTASEMLTKYPVGGILYSDDNIVDTDQFLEMVSNMRTFCKYETFMAMSDEGGSSSVFQTKGLAAEEEAILSQAEIGSSGGVAEAYSAGIAYGMRFRAFGLNVNFAPVADVTLVSYGSSAGRSFGKSVDTVASLAKNEMKGMLDQSIHPVIKYFPGYGDTKSDGSKGRVSSNRTYEDLQKTEGEVYKQLIDGGAEMIMVSMVNLPEVNGDDTPACFSNKIVTDLLRTELEYDGIVLTDYVDKPAVSTHYKEKDIAVNAILAGCDMIVSPSDFQDEYQGLLDAVKDGTVTEERINESLRRIFRLKYKNLVDYGTEEVDETETDVAGTADIAAPTEDGAQ